jgi:hypothetical protein
MGSTRPGSWLVNWTQRCVTAAYVTLPKGDSYTACQARAVLVTVLAAVRGGSVHGNTRAAGGVAPSPLLVVQFQARPVAGGGPVHACFASAYACVCLCESVRDARSPCCLVILLDY